ncbi:MAG TPA: hypothetical protein VEX62_12080 [Candidatus Limnocylindrales bacterium]|nr:hypothetical protein [Candidatus Limnocylindrales bacterium]
MVRVKELLGLAFYLACRAVASIFPPGMAYFLLWPYAALRGLRPAGAETHLPASRLPAPSGERPSYLRRWRFQSRIHQRWLPLLWTDRWKESRWSSRFSADGAERLDDIARQRPIVVMTLHTGGMIVLGGWLAQRGLGIGSVIVDRRVWARTQRMRSNSRWASRMGDSAAFLRGDARSMIRYLTPGRCLLLPADHERGHFVDGMWSGGRLRLSSGGFRIARLAEATVVPIIVTDDGRWRYKIHVGEPVPQELITAGDDEAAATHVAKQLMPIAATRPSEAAITLVGAAFPPEPA